MLILVVNYWTRVWLLLSVVDVCQIVWSPLVHHDDSLIRLPCGARYSKWWMQVFLPESLVKAMFHFSQELNACQLTPAECVILCAIQLTSPSMKPLSFITVCN